MQTKNVAINKLFKGKTKEKSPDDPRIKALEETYKKSELKAR